MQLSRHGVRVRNSLRDEPAEIERARIFHLRDSRDGFGETERSAVFRTDCSRLVFPSEFFMLRNWDTAYNIDGGSSATLFATIEFTNVLSEIPGAFTRMKMTVW